MVVTYVDKKNKNHRLSSENTLYILPYSGDIIINDIMSSFIYVNGDAIKVENRKSQIQIKDSSIDLSIDNKSFKIYVLCKPWKKEMQFDYNMFGKAFNNNMIDGRIDNEILYMALQETDDEELRLSLCTFNRSFDDIEKQLDIEKILEYVRKLAQVFNKPKQHLKQVNEIRAASVASRIGQESIRHLASHSEHWKGIKANGLIPERLLARVLENDIAIYENIVAKTLVDRLYKIANDMQGETLFCRMQTEMDDGISISSEQKSYYKAKELLLKGLDEIDIISKQEFLDKQAEALEEIINILISCKSTRLYRELKRQKPIRGKLKKTNIFMKDKNYKYVYKLWNILDSSQKVSFLDSVKPIEDEYEAFCKTLFVFALKYFNFEPINEEVDIFEGVNFLQTEYKFKGWNIKVSNLDIDNEIKGFRVNISNFKERAIDISDLGIDDTILNNIFTTIRMDKGVLYYSRVLNNEEQEELLSKAKIHWSKKKQRINSLELKKRLYEDFHKYSEVSKEIVFIPWKFCLPENIEQVKETLKILKNSVASIDFDECYILTISRPNELSGIEDNEVLSSTLFYGEANKDKNLEKSNIGVLPISMSDINSYRRYTKILLKNMVETDNERKTCPICGGEFLKDNNECLCKKCGYELIDTKCPNCKKIYTFSRYKLSKLFESKLNTIGFKILFDENRLSYKNITEATIIGGKIIPICIHCGYNSKK